MPLGLRGKDGLKVQPHKAVNPPREMSVDDSGTETICMSLDLHLGDA